MQKTGGSRQEQKILDQPDKEKKLLLRKNNIPRGRRDWIANLLVS